MSLILQGSTSGSITLQEPAVSGSTVLTLPAVTGTVLTTTSPKAGNVIQVVNATYSTSVSNSTNTYADTGLSASITPSSSSSKILVIVEIAGIVKYSVNTYAQLRLVRNSGAILYFEGLATYTVTASTNAIGGSGCNYLDSPATTSATTYKVQFASGGNVSAVYVQDFGSGINVSTSTMTLMEIAA
jgi:hypothetical protein